MPGRQNKTRSVHTQWVRPGPILLAVVGFFLDGPAASAQLGAAVTAPRIVNSDAANDTREDDSPRLATDGHGQWLAVWEATNPTADIGKMDSDVYVARSADNGETWTNPLIVNSDGASDLFADFNPDVATDGQGNWVVVWYGVTDTTGSDAEIQVARSSNNGETWSTLAMLNTNAATDDGTDQSPRITTDGKGTWICVWESFSTLGNTIGTDTDILFSRSIDNGATWSPPAPLNTNAGIDTQRDNDPQLATDRQGNWVAVWHSQDTLGGTIGSDLNILVARSSDNGVTWTAPAPLNTNASTNTGDDYQPQISTDSQGHWVAVWVTEDTLGGALAGGPNIVASRSSDNGATWTAPALLSASQAGDTADDFAPSLATDGHGQWVVTWESNNNLRRGTGDNEILVSRSTDNGVTWTTPARLNTNGGSDSGDDVKSALATDGLGHWLAVWNSNDSLGGTIGTDKDILGARFVLPDCNLNGVLDSQDIANGTSQDCDANGVPDECETDTDGDHVIDACDGCPGDAAKTAAGVCGCGVSDTDTDGDGTPDCNDSCPDDPAKTVPGNCGCGTPEADCASPSSGSCGAGACGPGAGVVLPLTMLCLQLMKRRKSRVAGL